MAPRRPPDPQNQQVLLAGSDSYSRGPQTPACKTPSKKSKFSQFSTGPHVPNRERMHHKPTNPPSSQAVPAQTFGNRLRSGPNGFVSPIRKLALFPPIALPPPTSSILWARQRTDPKWVRFAKARIGFLSP